jgi:hypothetical protein
MFEPSAWRAQVRIPVIRERYCPFFCMTHLIELYLNRLSKDSRTTELSFEIQGFLKTNAFWQLHWAGWENRRQKHTIFFVIWQAFVKGLTK